MGNIIRSPNGNAIALSERSGSHAIAKAAALSWWPGRLSNDPTIHPAACAPEPHENWRGDNPNVGIVVRNPVERFCSMCARHPERSVDEQIAQPSYGPILKGAFVKYFKYENGLQVVADWMEFSVPLDTLADSDPADKPTLTPDQESRVREIYADDISLWESLP